MANTSTVYYLDFKPAIKSKARRTDAIQAAKMIVISAGCGSVFMDRDLREGFPEEKVWKLSVSNPKRFADVRLSIEDFFTIQPVQRIVEVRSSTNVPSSNLGSDLSRTPTSGAPLDLD